MVSSPGLVTGRESRGLRTVAPVEAEIVVAGADGSGERVIATHLTQTGDFLGWSPDGKLIAFDRDEGIFVVRPDGSGERLLAESRPLRGAAWRPAVPLPTAKRAPCPLR